MGQKMGIENSVPIFFYPFSNLTLRTVSSTQSDSKSNLI